MTSFTEVGTVFVPVTDQERSLGFYVNTLGFEKRVDFGYAGGIRWIELAPPGAANTIALVPPDEGNAIFRTDGAFCAFATTDIDADHVALVAAARRQGRPDRRHRLQSARADGARCGGQ